MPLHHHTLVAWQRADDLFIRLHQLSLKVLPAFERFELVPSFVAPLSRFPSTSLKDLPDLRVALV